MNCNESSAVVGDERYRRLGSDRKGLKQSEASGIEYDEGLIY